MIVYWCGEYILFDQPLFLMVENILLFGSQRLRRIDKKSIHESYIMNGFWLSTSCTALLSLNCFSRNHITYSYAMQRLDLERQATQTITILLLTRVQQERKRTSSTPAVVLL